MEREQVEYKVAYDEKVEQSILGCMLIDKTSVEIAVKELSPNDFYKEPHQSLFSVMERMYRERKPIDIVTVNNEMCNGKMEESGISGVYLADLSQCVPTTANLSVYIAILKEKSTERQEQEIKEKLKIDVDKASLNEVLPYYLDVVRAIGEKNEVMPEELGFFIKKEFPNSESYWEGVLDQQSKIIIGGGSKIGKSMILLNLALSLASGKSYLNFPVLTPVKILFLQAEISDKNLQQRLVQMKNHLDREISPKMFFVKTVRGLRLETSEGFNSVCKYIDEVRPSVVFFDPLSCFHVRDENKASEMRDLLNRFDQLISKYKISVVISHHHRKPSQQEIKGAYQLRGSGVLFDWGDGYLTLNHTKERTLSLEFTLRNAESPPKHIILKNENLFFEVVAIQGVKKLDNAVILEKLKRDAISHKEITQEVGEEVGVNPKTVARRLNEMEKQGLLKSMGRKPKTWQLYLPGQKDIVPYGSDAPILNSKSGIRDGVQEIQCPF
jgi:replicative DNA helicase